MEEGRGNKRECLLEREHLSCPHLQKEAGKEGDSLNVSESTVEGGGGKKGKAHLISCLHREKQREVIHRHMPKKRSTSIIQGIMIKLRKQESERGGRKRDHKPLFDPFRALEKRKKRRYSIPQYWSRQKEE